MFRRVLLAGALLVGLLPGTTPALSEVTLTPALLQMYALTEMSPPNSRQMTVCYGFGCRLRLDLPFMPEERKLLTDLMNKGKASPADERKAIQQAFVWWDHRVAREIGSDKRIANADVRAFDSDHNFDCWDTTRNASSFLLVLQEWGLLRHHRVTDPRYRGNLFVGQLPHNTAVLKETAGGGTSWVVDQWPTAFGQVPDVMTLDKWLDET